MKLSELVNFYSELLKTDPTDLQKYVDHELNNIIFVYQDSQLIEKQKKIEESFNEFQNHLNIIRNRTKSQIEQLEKPYFLNSYQNYEDNQKLKHEYFNDTSTIWTNDYGIKIKGQNPERIKELKVIIDQILNRRLDISTKTELLLRNRIKKYTDWQHPALIIHPGQEPFIDDMVANDPLYLVDERHDLLEPTLNKFNLIYQRRLRPYIINEIIGQPILDRIPEKQFGLILVYNFFNYRPFEIIKQYLEELHNKLKPGGVLIITINDCDRKSAVTLVERNYACYTPGQLVFSLSDTLGFEKIFTYHDEGPSTWIELRKPGQLPSLRGGQALAKILPK